MTVWRVLSLLAVIALTNGGGWAQNEVANPLTTPPDISILVAKMPIGADMVTITLRAPNYPLLTLQSQCKALGVAMGSDSRGLQIFKMAPAIAGGPALIKASFATDGIINRQTGDLHMEAIVRNFVGTPPPYSLKSFLISYDGERPTGTTVQQYSKGPIRLQGVSSLRPQGIEYHIVTETQNPALVHIPSTVEKQPQVAKVEPAPKGNLHPLVIPLLCIGVLGTLALVYFGVMRRAT